MRGKGEVRGRPQITLKYHQHSCIPYNPVAKGLCSKVAIKIAAMYIGFQRPNHHFN